MKNKVIAMIPAAGRGSRMLSLTDNCPKAMLPLKNKPIIGWHLDKLIDEGINDVCLIVGYKKEKLINYVNKFYGDKLNITYIEQTELLGLAHAIKLGIDAIKTKYSYNYELLIILGDTIIQDSFQDIILQEHSIIGYNIVDDYKRWCLIKTNNNNEITEFVDKPNKDPNTRKAIIGIYYFKDANLLNKCIELIIDQNIKIKNEYQLSSAMEKYKEYSKLLAHKFDQWFDCGEVETFNKTRQNITRHFNSIEVTDDKTIVKKSTNENKIKQEINWYLNIPNKLRVYVPQLIDYSIIKNNVFYELEYVNFTPMQELFLYNLPDLSEWNKFLGLTFDMIERFNIHSTGTRFNATEHVSEILLDKTKQRVNELINTNKYFNELFNLNYIKINGNTYKNINLIWNNVENYLKENVINNSAQYWQVIHGDLFFGNMLYDINSSTLKIIDPRGNFGIDGIYGDIRYDLAKLNHSILGKYDFIVNDLYALNINHEYEYDYIIYSSERHNDVLNLLKQQVENRGYDYKQILVITGLLFLSMIPLHKENQNNQIMFYLKAVEILNNLNDSINSI